MEDFVTIERGFCRRGTVNCSKLQVTDWLNDVKNLINPNEIMEVRFKNTRKDYYRNVNYLKLEVGDIVAVEASPGHDIGIISLKGDLVIEQMKKHRVTLLNGDFRKIYRKAKQVDIDKWRDAIILEHETMIKSRQIAANLGLDMKIGDVEYQGDKTKAIFYYIADERIDFRQLIKDLAEAFRIRIEMKQIGARQEAGRIGGIGPCGRELCCATWISNFVSVSTNAARYQEITINPQKLAGQCGKLKCCLNFEVDSYIDAQKDFPSSQVPLETEKGKFIFQKMDIFRRVYWYSLQDEAPLNQVSIDVDLVKEIQRMNRSGKKPQKISPDGLQMNAGNGSLFQNQAGQESLARFDINRQPGKNKKRYNRPNRR